MKKFIETAKWYREHPRVHVLTVHRPVPPIGGMSRVISKATLEKYYLDETTAAMRGARRQLDKAGMKYECHAQVGQIAESVVGAAKKLGCDFTYMGTRGLGAVSGLVMGSTATKVLHLTSVPVVLVR